MTPALTKPTTITVVAEEDWITFPVGSRTLDLEERIPLVTELSIAVNERCPFVPLYMKNNTRAYNSDLQGFNCTANGITHYNEMSWSN